MSFPKFRNFLPIYFHYEANKFILKLVKNLGTVNQLLQNVCYFFFLLVGGAHLFADVSLLLLIFSLLSSSSDNEDHSSHSNPSINFNFNI